MNAWRTAAVGRSAPHPALRETTERGWFLKDSSWNDPIWVFAPTSLLEVERPQRVHWDFPLSKGQCFTDPGSAALLESARQLIALIRTRGSDSHLPQRASSVAYHFNQLRRLIQWMHEEHVERFAELEGADVLRFLGMVSRRKGLRGTVSGSTVKAYLKLLRYLHHFREEIPDGLSFDPLLMGTPAPTDRRHHGVRRYTPDEISVPLIQGAIALLESGAIDILRAREIYVDTLAKARRGSSEDPKAHALAARHALRHVSIDTPCGTLRIDSLRALSDLIEHLYSACFIVISYLVGPRASEVLHLQAGCLQVRFPGEGSTATDLVVMAGRIFKHEAYHGRVHEWVVADTVVHAISVLEALSAPHRLHSGRNDLWLRGRGRGRQLTVTEWQRGHAATGLPTTDFLTAHLNRFAKWLGVPTHEGVPWHLTTHQGRRTFIRFAALRDRSAIFALAQHLGHRDPAITDRCYVGTDYALDAEIGAEVLEQSVNAWEHMLSAPALGGRAGSEILAKRPEFGGVRMKDDVKAYARMLVEAGLTLGVCDWGFCVYRQEYSACRGNAAGPNPVHREPSSCARCKNFVVSAQHRTYWRDQMSRHQALLNEPALPTQTLKIARQRLEEARAMIQSIDSSPRSPAP
jgi:integrase